VNGLYVAEALTKE